MQAKQGHGCETGVDLGRLGVAANEAANQLLHSWHATDET